MQTRSLKNSRGDSASNLADNGRWMRSVIDDENYKPLEVSKDFILDYEKRENQQSEKLAAQVERHIETLKMLRGKLEKQAELQSRQEEFREWKREFKAKKSGVLTGKTLAEIGYDSKSNSAANNESGNPNRHTSSASRRSNLSSGEGQNKELKTVLESLSKLAELETRITSLEQDNAYDHLRAQDVKPVAMRTTLEFKKQRTEGGREESVRTTFALRKKAAPWLQPDRLKKKSVMEGGFGLGRKTAGGSGAAAAKMKRAAGAGGGVFLTEQGEDGGEEEQQQEMNAWEARYDRAALQFINPPPGQLFICISEVFIHLKDDQSS